MTSTGDNNKNKVNSSHTKITDTRGFLESDWQPMNSSVVCVYQDFALRVTKPLWSRVREITPPGTMTAQSDFIRSSICRTNKHFLGGRGLATFFAQVLGSLTLASVVPY